jgi:excisionase family DNA binding protein
VEPLLTVEEVARLLSVSRATVYELASEGKIAHYRVSSRGKRGTIRFDIDQVHAFLDANEVQADGVPESVPVKKKPGKPRELPSLDL